MNELKPPENDSLSLLNYLKIHQITQIQVAIVLGIHRTTVNRYLHGDGAFTTKQVETMRLKFGIPIETFFVTNN